MNNRVWIFLSLIVLTFTANFHSAHAQESTACPQNAAYWDRWQENAELRSRMTGSMWNVTSFDVSPDGSTLAAANGKSLAFYDTETLTLESKFEFIDPTPLVSYRGSYREVNWSPDGHQVAVAYYVPGNPDDENPVNGIQIWDEDQNQQMKLFPGNTMAVAWSPDGSNLAVADVSGDILLWDTTRGIDYTLYERDPFKGSLTEGLVWSPDAQYLVAIFQAGGALRLYTLDGSKVQLIESPDEMVSYISWSPGSDQLVTGNWISSYLYIFDLSTREITKILDGSTGNPFEVHWSPDGRLIARGTQKGLFLWDMTSGSTTPFRVFDENMPAFVRMAWLPDSQHLISVDFEGSLYRWDVETGCVEAALLKFWKPG
jgi:WD40 repeat protein